ncbi:hypothetical protein R1flu_002459 [Riccia fluitans]|uniref:Dynein heavy chain n=1 Tax=Riccia fluitans TaxID=41844 RepID=A0ABD1Y762_9MARC
MNYELHSNVGQVEEQMVLSVQDQCLRGVSAYAVTPRPQWVLEWPGQVVLVVCGIYWTQAATEAILKGENALPEFQTFCTNQLGDIVNLVRGNLTNLNRMTLSALVVMDVHSRDTIALLAGAKVTYETDFLWQSQLRMYWEQNTCWLRMMNAGLEYGYEYLGNSSRLVITPLTDRCYRTLMGAIHLGMGGAPEGPAGTGKTETTKDLAKAVARQCVVFNCSDSLDYITMAKFFKGLAASGAWSCFDEFNRIDLEVLSVIAQQVLEIQIAVQNKLKTFTFEGTELTLKHSCNVFITMNPGYAGRSELPDNLKALFRTVAMMVPDYAMISEIILYSGGYLLARDCARKIVATYRLCSEQLSSQEHYDYGMRAVIAVLRAATNLKQRYPEEDELVLMLRSIIDVNLCKFLSQDVPLFNGIVTDLFPGVVLPAPDYTLIDEAIKENCAQMNLQPTFYFITKIVQLYEMIIVRHGLMLVGLSFSGKTSCLRVLQRALTDMSTWGNNNERPVQIVTVNPKSVTMGQLYGQADNVTQEWVDGVLAVRFREQAYQQNKDRKWLVLDGPVDAIWIENMNTVLDDNKKLCLPNSEIIQMSSSMNMIFEVGDLAVASPATVSRCGMVYLEPHQLGWHPLMISWINTLPACFPAKVKAHLRGLFEWMVNACLRFVRKHVKEISPTGDTALVVSLMRTFYSLIDEVKTEEGVKALGLDKLDIWVDSIFVFSLVWSIGSTGENDARAGFDELLRKLAAGITPEGYELVIPIPHENLLAPMMPSAKSVHDFVFDKVTAKWRLWSETIVPVEIPVEATYDQMIIPTKDQMRYTFLLDKAIMYGSPFLLVGGTGVGKSVYVNRHLLKGLSKEKFNTILVCLSARTSANMVQSQIDGQLDRRKRGIYGPPAGKKCIIFVDDLNMPQPEVYGAQPPIELLRQFMDFAGWYGRDCKFRSLVDVQFVSAMGPPGGGRNLVTQRYLRHYNQVGVSQVAGESLKLIFSTILNWHLCTKNEFPTDVVDLAFNVIDATMEIYDSAVKKLLPTPTKSHYTFNLRDYARVIQGLMLQEPRTVHSGKDGAKQFMRLWVHEVLRVFYDRLVDHEDRDWLLKLIKQLVIKYFNEDFDRLFNHLLSPPKVMAVTQFELRCLFFGDFVIEDPENRMYDEIKDIPNLMSVVENYLKDFNGISKRPMNLAIFLFAVEHVSRICRVLKQPGGHMLLVGVGGSGRQSLTRLAASIYQMEVFQVEISRGYTKVEWREDLMNMLKRAGADPGKPAVFLFSDTQITDEGFVEDINNLLNSGEVPNMFPADEKAQVIEISRDRAAKEGKVLETMMEIWKFFVDKCKQNLHVILAMSPVGQAFKDRLRQFPSLVNCCTIDWFQEWPNDALEAVAVKFLKAMDLEDWMRDSIVQICKAFHETVRVYSIQFKDKLGRQNYLTPTSYLELINTFQTLLSSKREDNLKQRSRYEVGLDKLASSAAQVAVMQTELTALMPKLVVTVAEVEKLMAVVEKEKQEKVEPKKQIVLRDEAEATKQANDAKVIKDECEVALSGALPVLEEALLALDTLSANDINYVKKLTNPPAAIKLVMEAVCVILEVKPAKLPDGKGGSIQDYWKPSVLLLNNKDFLQSLKDYDKDNIDPKVIAKIRSQYTTNPEFTPAKAANASTAAEGLCKWIIAMDKYDLVARVVAPKKQKLALAEAAYQEVMKGLLAKQTELKGILDELAKLEKELEKNMLKKEGLQHEVKTCTVKIERAEQLIGGLGGERTRWKAAAKHLQEIYPDLTGDSLVAAGIISYLGAFTSSYRDEIVESWMKLIKEKKIPHSPTFTFRGSFGDPVQIRRWVIAGLPNDSVSVDNGIIVANSRRWPLMIDPQGQANKWVRNMERERNLQIIKLGDANYIRTLENAIQFGLPVLLENIGEELDPALEPLLLKQIFKSAGVVCIRLGDATIEYHNDFRFYITTKLRNPHYLPETQVKVSLLNFMITKDGLSDQLLGVVVAKERPDLEQQKSELVVQGAENKRRLKELEVQILEVLSTSEGNILEDETAIKIISEAKVIGNDITVKQGLAEVTEKNIDAARKGYQSCGYYTAVLFFCISDLGNIDPMYQYSLSWFVSLFVSSIVSSEKCQDLQKRLDIIQKHFLYSLYCNVCRSLFEKDKLLFSCLLASRLLEMGGEITTQEWMFFLTGGMASGENPPNPAKDWLLEKSWGELNRLNKFEVFNGLIKHFLSNQKEWRDLFEMLDPHKAKLPGPFAERLTPFQKLLVYRCIRPDKLIAAIQDFVSLKMGPEFIIPPSFSLDACYRDSSATCPLIFVLSPGSDPTAALLSYTAEKEMNDKVAPISLGQGQGPKATVMIKDASVAGSWVLLQNCHLAPSWMPSLERICENFSPESVHQDFRLWMTSYPSPKFPISVLQNGVKMTNEPPKGLRANMKRSYHLDPLSNEDFFDSCKRGSVFKSFLFGLAFFHGVVQERRTFGPLGWNIPYGFDDGDLRISVRQLHMLVNESAEGVLPLDALQYVTGECNYGGRVTDDKDRLLLNTILKGIYNEEMINPGYKLSESGLYTTPPEGNLQSYLEVIESYPLVTMPEAFGLHPNADITKDMNSTVLILNSLLLTSADAVGAGSGGGGGNRPGQGVAAVVKDILQTLPPNFDIEACELKYPVLYEESMNTVLNQEMTRFNKLLDRSRHCGRKYHTHRLNRFHLTSETSLQNYARRKKLAIDGIAFDFTMLDQEPRRLPDEGVYIKGLFLEGCAWDSQKKILCESIPKVIYVNAPTIWLRPMPIVDIPPSKTYNCPVYRTAERRGVLATTGHSTNFLMSIRMPTDKPPSHWTKRGVAMLCSLND